MKREQIEAYFAGKEPLLVEAVSRLVAIDSVEGAPAPGAPFGPGPAAALKEALAIAAEWGLAAQDHEGYVGTADLNGGEDALHILGHLDVVAPGEGWTVTQPYTPKLVDGQSLIDPSRYREFKNRGEPLLFFMLLPSAYKGTC